MTDFFWSPSIIQTTTIIYIVFINLNKFVYVNIRNFWSFVHGLSADIRNFWSYVRGLSADIRNFWSYVRGQSADISKCWSLVRGQSTDIRNFWSLVRGRSADKVGYGHQTDKLIYGQQTDRQYTDIYKYLPNYLLYNPSVIYQLYIVIAWYQPF